jgi:hypothetical protein
MLSALKNYSIARLTSHFISSRKSQSMTSLWKSSLECQDHSLHSLSFLQVFRWHFLPQGRNMETGHTMLFAICKDPVCLEAKFLPGFWTRFLQLDFVYSCESALAFDLRCSSQQKLAESGTLYSKSTFEISPISFLFRETIALLSSRMVPRNM